MSVDIGKIAVTFAANTEGFTRGVGSATTALMDFVKKSQDAGATLSGAFTADFGGTIDALTAKLASSALSGDAFGESIAGAFSKASKAIDGGLSNSFETLSKEIEVGMATGEEFADVFGELSGRAASAIDSVAEQSIEGLKKALEDGKMVGEEFAEALVQVAAGEAGAGLDQTRDATQALSRALEETAINGQEFLSLQREISQNATENALRRENEAVAALREQLDAAKLDASGFADNLRAMQTAFRVEAAAEFEAQIQSLAKAEKDGAISTEDFDTQQKILAATLEKRFIGQLQEELEKLPDAYMKAGGSAEDLASAQEEVNKQIEAGRGAAERVAARATAQAQAGAAAGGGGHGGGGGHAGGIMGGLERVGAVASIVPGEIGHVGHVIENIVHVSHAAGAALTNLGGNFAAIAGPVGIATGVSVALGGAILKLVSAFGEAALETSKLAAQFGITTREVAELQTVLKYVGSSTSEFGRVARTIQQNLSRAAEGARGAGTAFRRLGIDAQEMKELRFEDATTQVEEIVVALARIQNPAERSMLAVKLLGKQGAEFAAKFGTDVHEIEHRFQHAKDAVDRFNTSMTEADASQLIKARTDILGIGEATEGLGLTLANAFAPLASGLGSAVSDVIGTITNLLTAITPVVKIVGAAIGELFRVAGAVFNSLARIIGAVFDVLYRAIDEFFKFAGGGTTFLEIIQTVGMAVAGTLEGIAKSFEEIAQLYESWTTGKTIEELEEIKKQQREAAALGEAAANIQEKYGDRTEDIRAKIEEVNKLRSTMGSDGKPLISAEESFMALQDLNEELKKASPFTAMMTQENEKFEEAMKRASKEAADMGNNIAQGARANYFKAYEELLDQLKNKKITKELFDKSLEGLAERFDKEMEKAKPIKVISDQIEELAKKYNEKTGAAGVLEDFGKFQEARAAGGTFVGGVDAARMQRINEFGSGLGLDLTPKLEGFALYQSRMEEINKLHREAAKTTTNAAEEEKKFNQLRAATTKQLLEEIDKAVKAIGARKQGPMEKFVEDAKTLTTEYNKAKAAFNAAPLGSKERADAEQKMKDISERRFRNANEMGRAYQYEGSGEKAVREFNDQIADIGRARLDLMRGGMMNSPEMAALNNAERDAREKFNKENIDAIDRAMFGSNQDTRAAKGIDATSQEGVSTYFRIQREDHSVTKRQLEEARQSRILLQKIAENGGLSGAAAL